MKDNIRFIITSRIYKDTLYFNFLVEVNGIKFPLQVKGDYLSSRILFQLLNTNEDLVMLGDGEEIVYEK